MNVDFFQRLATERKRLKWRQSDMAAAGALTFRAMTSAFWDRDLQSDTMRWNDGMERLFGVPLASLPPDGSSWTLRLHPDDAPQVQQSLRQVIAGTAEFWCAQYRFRRQDGSYAWVDDRGFVLRDADGRLDLTLAPVYDRETKTKLLWIDNNTHQMFGTFTGQVMLDSGETLQVENITGFAEHAVNHW